MQISDDQNTITYKLEFVEDNSDDCCMGCYFEHAALEVVCPHVPCRDYERKDKKKGIFKEVKP
jgi:hypothetical protein